MLGLIVFIIINAVVDSLNPVTIAVHIYLLATPQPLPRTLAFMCGIFVAYFLGGILIEFGADKIVTELFANPGLVDYIIQLILGVVLVGFGYKYRKAGDQQDIQKPRSGYPLL